MIAYSKSRFPPWISLILLITTVSVHARARPEGIRTLIHDPDGFLWLGCDEGLFRSDGVRHVRDSRTDLTGITTLARSGDGTLWAASGSTLAQIGPVAAEHHELTAEIRAITGDVGGLHWLGTEAGMWQIENGTVTRYKPAIIDFGINALIADPDGTLWLGTDDRGLVRYLPGSSGVIPIRLELEGEADPIEPRVTALARTTDALWITTTGSTLYRFRPKSGELKRVPLPAGGRPMALTSMGRAVWVLDSANDLMYWNETSGELETALPGDTSIEAGALLVDRDGVVWRTADSRVRRFVPPGIEPVKDRAPVVVAMKMTAAGEVPRPVPIREAIALPDPSRGLTLELALLETPGLDEQRFRYSLDPEGMRWVILGERTLTLEALAPGRHRLLIAADHGDDRWTPSTAITLEVGGGLGSLSWLPLLGLGAIVVLLLWVNRRYAREHAAVLSLKNDNERLRVTDQERDRLLVDTTHELRTPLNGIVGIAESLRAGALGPLSTRQKQNLDLVIATGSRLANTVNDILDFTRLHESKIELEPRPLSLYPLAGSILALNTPMLHGRPVAMINAVPDDCPPVMADENRLVQILHNLVGNAVKVTSEGEIEIGARVEGDRVVVWVRDTGIGIAAEDQEAIFERFHQLENGKTPEGLGLGLAISHELVRLHGSRIELHSEPGKGCELRFSLPITSDPVLPAAGGVEYRDLRTLGGILPPDEASLMAHARAMILWHQAQQHCGYCGAATAPDSGGYARICTGAGCGRRIFPRVDPAIIVLVEAGDRCLLGRQPTWPDGRYSTIAGFVEPGESLEEAVRREVFEETNVRLAEVRYQSSQPWPFPSALMLGFRATADSGDIVLNDGELEDARWFTRHEIRAGWPKLPPRLSIARRLVDDWLLEDGGSHVA